MNIWKHGGIDVGVRTRLVASVAGIAVVAVTIPVAVAAQSSALPGRANIAPQATVTASSQNPGDGQTAAKAVDGSNAGYPTAATREWVTDGEGAGAWLRLTWPNPMTIDEVVLSDRPNDCDRVTGGRIRFSDGSQVPFGDLPNDGRPLSLAFERRTADSVKVEITGASECTSNAGLSEIQVWGARAAGESAAPATNRAPQAVATASSETRAVGQTASKAIDGKTKGYPAALDQEWASDGQGAGAWLQLTWPAAVVLDRVVLYDRPNDVDRITEARLLFGDGSSVPVPALSNDGRPTEVRFPPRQTASLKIEITAVAEYTQNVGLAEVEAWGPGAAPTPSTPPASPSPSPSPSATPSPSDSPTPSASPTPTPTATATPTPSVTPTPGGVMLTPVPEYRTGPWRGNDAFPIGVWLESAVDQSDVAADRDAGLNTYVGLTADSNPALAASSGLNWLVQSNEWLGRAGAAGATGWLLGDELDMQMEPARAFSSLQSTLSQIGSDNRLRYANYGKGVAFWNTDADAARFVNDFQDVVSADIYWFTDNNVCGQGEGGQLLAGGQRDLTEAECRRAANYAAVVKRLRTLDDQDGNRKPVWGFVELGHPASEPDWPSITPEQVRAAVWQSVIGGAQGIVYFNHSFGGSCPTHHALREACYAAVRDVVKSVNAQLTRLAPVLDSPTAAGYVAAEGVTTLTKRDGDDWYIFAGSDGGTGQRSFRVASGTRVEVVDEGRTLPVNDGVFTDTFSSSNTIHIYRVTGGNG